MIYSFLKLTENIMVRFQNIYRVFATKINFRKKILKKNLFLKNIYSGQEIYILGNGPSINNLDFDYLKDRKTMVVNYFLENNKLLNPTFLCVLDRAVNENYLRKSINNKDMISLVNIDFYETLKNEENVYFSYSSLLPNFSSMPKLSFNTAVSQTSNVITHAIMWALYMGFKKIILIGCEFDLACYKNSSHFYDSETKRSSINISYADHLQGAFKTLKFHYILNNYSKKRNIEIINSTPNSYIDAYKYKVNQNIYLEDKDD